MKSKGRYGQCVRWIFSIVDLLIVNLTFLASMYYWQHSTTPVDSNGLYSRPVWLVLNVAMVVGLYFYSNVHERRVFYAEKVVGQAVKLVLTHAGIFVTLTSFLGPSDAPWQPVLWFYVVFFIVLSTWWVISRQFVKLYRNRGFNFKRVIVIGGGADANNPYRAMFAIWEIIVKIEVSPAEAAPSLAGTYTVPWEIGRAHV